MNRALLKSIILLLPACMSMPAEADFSLDLSKGIFPKGVSVKNGNSLLPLGSEFYKNGWTQDGWTADRFGTRGYVAVSPTRTGTDTECDNRLTLPPTEVTAGMWLTWEALSMIDRVKESYRVEALAEGETTPVMLADIDGENGTWTRHAVSLDALAGKKAIVTFVCDTRNGYMLALDKVSVGTPSGEAFAATDLTPQYSGPEGNTVRGTAVNTGATVAYKAIVCLSSDAQGQPRTETRRIQLEGEWESNTPRDYSFDVPASIDARTYYTVAAETADGKTVEIFSGSYFSSAFRKMPFVDEGTGLWCVNCPSGMIQADRLKEHFGEEMVLVTAHVNDVFANQEYFNFLSSYSVPYFRLDRRRATAGSGTEKFGKYYDMPVKFGISITGVEYGETQDGARTATLTAEVLVADETDNNSGQYRIGYVLTGDYEIDADTPNYRRYRQSNSSTRSSDERFYYLPSEIPAELMSYHGVALSSGNDAFLGLEGSLTGTLTPGEPFRHTWTVELPEAGAGLKKESLAAYVLDTKTGNIENTCLIAIDSGNSAVDAITDDSAARLRNTANGLVTVDAGQESFTLTAYSLSGRLAREYRGQGQATIELGLPAGLYVLRLKAGKETATLKTAIR